MFAFEMRWKVPVRIFRFLRVDLRIFLGRRVDGRDRRNDPVIPAMRFFCRQRAGTFAETTGIREFGARFGVADPYHRGHEKLFATAAFKSGENSVLVVSKVANFAIDLPDANVAIEVSGTFGSRQEEAQRLGRVLRPKKGENKAYFYTIVSRDTREEDFSMHRQLFLAEQGYPYKIIDEDV